jgi:hypothetical protein
MFEDIRGPAADIWGSRGREFKSRQPDRETHLVRAYFPDEKNALPGAERLPFQEHFRRHDPRATLRAVAADWAPLSDGRRYVLM